MEAQAPPNTGARLSPQAIEALILRRLDALGHRPDLLDPYAIAALVADAGGSGRRLRSSLAATLFLASTENAPQIDAALVHRALTPVRPATVPPVPKATASPQARLTPMAAPQPGPTATAQTAGARPKWLKASRFYLVVGLAALAVSLTNLVLRAPSGEPAPGARMATPVQTAGPAADALPPPAPIQLPVHTPVQEPPSHAATPAPAQATPPDQPAAGSAPTSPAPAAPPPATLAPLPPAVAVSSPPVPDSSLPVTTTASLPPLPAGAPPAIVLLYPARDPGALDRLRPLALKLQNAGMTDIRAKPVHAPPPRRVISYFYSDDRPLADTIAKTLSGSAWPRLNGNALQPSLVLPPPGLPGRNPGTIEVQLP